MKTLLMKISCWVRWLKNWKSAFDEIMCRSVMALFDPQCPVDDFFVPPSRLIVTLLNCFMIYVRLFVIVWLLKSSFDDVSWNGTERWCFVLALHYSSGLHVRLLTDWLIRRSHVTGVVACSFCTAVGYDCYCCWTCSFMRRDFHHLVEGPGLLAVICALRRWSRCIYCDNSTADFFHTLHRHR